MAVAVPFWSKFGALPEPGPLVHKGLSTDGKLSTAGEGTAQARERRGRQWPRPGNAGRPQRSPAMIDYGIVVPPVVVKRSAPVAIQRPAAPAGTAMRIRNSGLPQLAGTET